MWFGFVLYVYSQETNATKKEHGASSCLEACIILYVNGKKQACSEIGWLMPKAPVFLQKEFVSICGK